MRAPWSLRLVDDVLVELVGGEDRACSGTRPRRACGAPRCESQARSPESSRMPGAGRRRARAGPCPTSTAWRTPVERVVGVDEQDAVVGHRLGVGARTPPARRRRASPSCGRGCPAPGCRTACRPARWRSRRTRRGRPRGRPPGRRRCPGRAAGRTPPPGRPRAASTMRAALVAMRVWKLTMVRSGVSSSMQGTIGPRTRISGSPGRPPCPRERRRRPRRARGRQPVEERRGRRGASRRARQARPGRRGRRASNAEAARLDGVGQAGRHREAALERVPPERRWKTASFPPPRPSTPPRPW